jgi:hypothetical protein
MSKSSASGKWNRSLTVFSMFVIISASVLGFITYGLPLLRTGGLPLSTEEHFIGSSGLIFVGWSMPSNVLFSTTFVTNEQISGFISGTLMVFPYHILDGTILTLGLYVNGNLVARQDYAMSNGPHPAALLGGVAGDVANFTTSTAGYSVALLEMKNPLPAGTRITVTASTNNPIWVEIDDSMPWKSNLRGAAYQVLPDKLSPEGGVLAAHTLSSEVEFNAP